MHLEIKNQVPARAHLLRAPTIMNMKGEFTSKAGRVVSRTLAGHAFLSSLRPEFQHPIVHHRHTSERKKNVQTSQRHPNKTN